MYYKGRGYKATRGLGRRRNNRHAQQTCRRLYKSIQRPLRLFTIFSFIFFQLFPSLPSKHSLLPCFYSVCLSVSLFLSLACSRHAEPPASCFSPCSVCLSSEVVSSPCLLYHPSLFFFPQSVISFTQSFFLSICLRVFWLHYHSVVSSNSSFTASPVTVPSLSFPSQLRPSVPRQCSSLQLPSQLAPLAPVTTQFFFFSITVSILLRP